MTTRLLLSVNITLRSPFLFRDASGGIFGVDMAALRHADGRPLIPADQLRGVLRHALADIVAAAPEVFSQKELDQLFGKPAADSRDDATMAGANFAPERGAILCGDLIAEQPDANGNLSVRVAIEPETGAARTGALMFAELCAPPGQEVLFAGEIVVLVPAGREARTVTALDRALKLLVAIGAQKSVGYGEVTRAALREVSRRTLNLPAPPVSTTSTAKPGAVAYRMRFDRPFLVDATREADNLYVGAEVVPGAVVKGALARRLTLAGEDPETGSFAGLLAAMIVSHAFPENLAGQASGHALPLSLVAEEAAHLLVADSLGLEADKGVLFKNETLRPGLYATDWKGWHDAVAQRVGWPPHLPPGRELRVHTAIDQSTGGAADGLLFATVARSHRFPDEVSGAATGPVRAWRLCLTPPAEADADRWAQLLALLESGLDGIGRTGASATFERLLPEDARLPPARPVIGHASRYAVVLTTPAVMTPPNPGLTATDAYRQYWSAVLPGATLMDHVASQRLAGGYQAQRRRMFGAAYVPFVLTEPGSVFLLDNVTGEQLDALMQTGLPVAALGGAAPDWRNCPFTPENGFGAFTAHYLADALAFDEVVHV